MLSALENAASLLTVNDVKQPDMPISGVCSGQKQILPQKTANKNPIRQNNRVVTKWPFDVTIRQGSANTPMRPCCNTQGVGTLMHSNNNVSHRVVPTSAHTGPRTAHRIHIYLCPWKAYLILTNGLRVPALTNGWWICQHWPAAFIGLFCGLPESRSVFVERKLKI